MSFLNFKELRDLNDESIIKEIVDTKKSLLNHIYLSTIDAR